jgi:hypothetical protein
MMAVGWLRLLGRLLTFPPWAFVSCSVRFVNALIACFSNWRSKNRHPLSPFVGPPNLGLARRIRCQMLIDNDTPVRHQASTCRKVFSSICTVQYTQEESEGEYSDLKGSPST